MDKKDIIIFDFVYRNRYSRSIFKQSDFLPTISQKYSQAMQDKLMDVWSSKVTWPNTD
ncbi:hypothetical protein [Trichococcus shcherbakoviae]|uniref:hypothetical protein n=1 Tax=Trichococcus shcherbakoviae TaxID=2094020 RepID=UPI00135BE9B8|nr:hypothetical protein [Trichococcus shcherbakoviae]